MLRPILFNTEMVRAILEGRKTKTRRIVKGFDPGVTAYRLENHPVMQSTGVWEFACRREENGAIDDFFVAIKSPYDVGDVLWVRETWRPSEVKSDGGAEYFYYADGLSDASQETKTGRMKWKPSIHMPKEAARIFLKVSEIHPERLQFITEDDAVAEGVKPEPPFSIPYPYTRGFILVWENTMPNEQILHNGWDANPWVWVIKFERVDKPAEWEEYIK